jgi:hypothetical protein
MYLVFISSIPYSWQCNNHLFIWAVQHMDVGSKHGFESRDKHLVVTVHYVDVGCNTGHTTGKISCTAPVPVYTVPILTP